MLYTLRCETLLDLTDTGTDTAPITNTPPNLPLDLRFCPEGLTRCPTTILTTSHLRHILSVVTSAIQTLSQSGVRPTPQRIAVIDFVLSTDAHPTADEVLAHVRTTCPTISRATVYNTLNLLVSKGLLRTQLLREGTVVFDPKNEAHHHFIDDETGRIYDVPWDALTVSGEDTVAGFNVRDYQVVMRGSVDNRRPTKKKKRKPHRDG